VVSEIFTTAGLSLVRVIAAFSTDLVDAGTTDFSLVSKCVDFITGNLSGGFTFDPARVVATGHLVAATALVGRAAVIALLIASFFAVIGESWGVSVVKRFRGLVDVFADVVGECQV